jgi:hypothetical protein
VVNKEEANVIIKTGSWRFEYLKKGFRQLVNVGLIEKDLLTTS